MPNSFDSLDRYKPRPDGYTRQTRGGVRKLIHVWVWEDHFGPVPKGMQIHHVNGKHSDNKIKNLQLVTPLEHKRLHGGCEKFPNGDWLKPCNKCGEKLLVSTHFYKRNTNSIHSECVKCVKKRNVADKRKRRQREK